MPRHHSYVARMLVTLFAEGGLPNVKSVEVEPEFGQVVRVAYRGGGLRLVKGNDVGLNSWAAIETLRDKEFTILLLRSSGRTWTPSRTSAPSVARSSFPLSSSRSTSETRSFARSKLPTRRPLQGTAAVQASEPERRSSASMTVGQTSIS